VTATTAKAKADPLAALDSAREQLDEARRDRAQVGEQSRAFQVEMQSAAGELEHLARTDRSQFGEDGQPLPKTRAAELRAKLDQAGSSRWPDIVAGAEDRLRRAQEHVRGVTADNAVELARLEYDRGLAATERLRGLAADMRAAIVEARATEPALLGITTALGGVFDGRDVQVDPRWQQLEQFLDALETLEPARIPRLTPYVDEEPSVFRCTSGWVPARSAAHVELVEQPPKMERPS
jgi:hypothetical protein